MELLALLAYLLGPGAPGIGVPPCPQEDGPPPCYWDASQRGNGIGSSFTLWAGGANEWEDELVVYWD